MAITKKNSPICAAKCLEVDKERLTKKKKRPRKVGKKKEISNNPSITPIYYLIKIVTRHESFGPFFLS